MTDTVPRIRNRPRGAVLLGLGILLVVLTVVYMRRKRAQQEQAAADAAAAATQANSDSASTAHNAVSDLYSPFSQGSYPYSPAGMSSPYSGYYAGAYGQPSAASPAAAGTTVAAGTPGPAGSGSGATNGASGAANGSNSSGAGTGTGTDPAPFQKPAPVQTSAGWQPMNPAIVAATQANPTYQQIVGATAAGFAPNDIFAIGGTEANNSNSAQLQGWGYQSMMGPNGPVWVGIDSIGLAQAAGYTSIPAPA